MFWEANRFSEPAQLALRVALIETSMRKAEPEHALLAMLADEQSALSQAGRFLRPTFNPKSLRDSVVLRIKSSLSVDPPSTWSDLLMHDKLRAVLSAAQALPEWSAAEPDYRNQLVAAEVVAALAAGVKAVITRGGVAPDELEARLRKPPQKRDAGATLWSQSGGLNMAAFDRPAQRVLRLMEAEGQGRGLNRLVTSLALLGFASVENGILPTGLRLQAPAVELKKLRDNLSLHVQSLGTGRFNAELTLRRDQMQAGVIQMLEHSLIEADAVEVTHIGEAELLKAFLLVGDPFVDSFLRNEKVEFKELSKYVSQRRTGEVTAEPEGPKLLTVPEIEARLRDNVIGQDHAIDTVMPMIKRLRFGYLRRGRPAGVLLFVGLSGTGKTQLAKEIARGVYGSEEQLIFLEMGQFGSEHSKTAFVGAPPGLVGYGEGILTNGLRDKPECVVLFDEVEKAHKSVFDVVLRFLDEGQISDPSGVVRDGRRCILVLTSNLGVKQLRKLIVEQTNMSEEATPAKRAEIRAKVRETLLDIDFFRPEFLNRVDETVLFNQFTEDSFRRIIGKMLAHEVSRFREEKDLVVQFDNSLRDLLVRECVERADEGARVCGRLVSDYIVTPLIDFFLAHEDVRAAAVSLDAQSRVSVQAIVS